MSLSEQELELLEKIEAQNRALLADEKAVYLWNGKCRAESISSSFSNESSADGTKVEVSTISRPNGSAALSFPSLMIWANNGISSSAPVADQWAHILANWDQFAKKRSHVSALLTKGLPDEYRPQVWRLLTGAHTSDAKELYADYLSATSQCERAIRRDIARTFPRHDLFKEENGFGQESLFRVMKAYSVHDTEVGYCQGSGFIAGLLLMQLPEADAFAVLTQLMEKYHMRDLYKPSMLQLGVCMYQLEQLMAEHLPELHLHFLTQSLSPALFASAWFLTLFSTVLPIPMAMRTMDLFIAEGFPFVFRMALAVLKFSARRLLSVDMESMVVYFQNEGPDEWGRNADVIFDSAATIKLNSRKMKKLEKEYMQVRSKEREDQIELRRLRNENSLLLQRIAKLDEECTSMANRLIHSQLVRAQESEAALALRCELSLLRRSRTGAKPRSDSPQTSAEEYPSPACDVQATSPHDEDDSVEQFRTDLLKVTSESPPIPTKAANPCHPTLLTNGSTDLADLLSYQSTRSLSYTLPSRMSRVRHTIGPSDQHDTWMLTTLSRLQAELAASRAAEAETRVELADLKERYHTLQQSSLAQSIQSADTIASLNDELCGLRLRENHTMDRMQELQRRLGDFETRWQAHASQCKSSRSLSNGFVGRTDVGSRESAQRMSDALLENHYLQEIARLTQQVQDLTAQKTRADHRAERHELRVQQLADAQTQWQSIERDLRRELKQAVQLCAETEAQRHADMVLWRTRVMEMTTEMTELRQRKVQLECEYEGLLAHSQSTMPDSTDWCGGGGNGDVQSHHLESTPETDSPVLDRTLSRSVRGGRDQTLTQPVSTPVIGADSDGPSVWKTFPASVMTDSIGPLEDLCLVPERPDTARNVVDV